MALLYFCDWFVFIWFFRFANLPRWALIRLWLHFCDFKFKSQPMFNDELLNFCNLRQQNFFWMYNFFGFNSNFAVVASKSFETVINHQYLSNACCTHQSSFSSFLKEKNQFANNVSNCWTLLQYWPQVRFYLKWALKSPKVVSLCWERKSFSLKNCVCRFPGMAITINFDLKAFSASLSVLNKHL